MMHVKYVRLNICCGNMHAFLNFIIGFKLIQYSDCFVLSEVVFNSGIRIMYV